MKTTNVLLRIKYFARATVPATLICALFLGSIRHCSRDVTAAQIIATSNGTDGIDQCVESRDTYKNMLLSLASSLRRVVCQTDLPDDSKISTKALPINPSAPIIKIGFTGLNVASKTYPSLLVFFLPQHTASK